MMSINDSNPKEKPISEQSAPSVEGKSSQPTIVKKSLRNEKAEQLAQKIIGKAETLVEQTSTLPEPLRKKITQKYELEHQKAKTSQLKDSIFAVVNTV
ncbi:MAG: hypothetical protein H0W50_09385, partial [Parachlamydiaceae bacterium]|nr:hypothetical protein [Parachlamydiaceae bacterium]